MSQRLASKRYPFCVLDVSLPRIRYGYQPASASIVSYKRRLHCRVSDEKLNGALVSFRRPVPAGRLTAQIGKAALPARHIYEQCGYEDVNYLDDLGAAENEDQAQEAFDCLGMILQELGIQEAVDKAAPPSFKMIFLGILINTILMTLEIMAERREELAAILKDWTVKKSATLKEIQSLLGKLNFVCTTVRAGRVFITRIIEEIKGFPRNGRRRLSTQIRKDINWWRLFMTQFDGITIIPEPTWCRPDEVIATDASLIMGGGWSRPNYFKTVYPEWLKNKPDVSINELELITVVVALKLWGRRVKNANILAYCDNQSSVDIVNSGKARNKFAQSCLRETVFLLAHNNAVLKLVYLSSESNRIPDALSRWWMGHEQQQRFRKLTHHIDTKEDIVNRELFRFTHDW